MSSRNRFGLPLLLLLAVLFIQGCGTLDPAGPYHGNQVLADTDQLLITSKDTLDGFTSWELKYRGTRACPPDATRGADVIRREAPKAFADAWRAREAYASAVTSTNTTSLQQALGVVRELLSIAVSWNPQRAATPP